MALLKAFQKQSEMKPCPVCGNLIAQGLYRSHLSCCKLQPGDDDCQIIAEVSTESRKRDVLESAISLDLSEDLFRSVGDEEIAEGSDSKERRDSESFPVHIVNNEDVSTSAKERNQIANKRMSRSFASKRPKKIKISPSGSTESTETVEQVDSFPSMSVENTIENFYTKKSVALKKCSKSEKRPDIGANDSNERDIFHPNATTSLEIKVEANLSLHNTLKNIKYYLDVCDCNLVINTQTQSNQNDDVIEDAQVGSPYYLTIFHKIMKRVFCSRGQYGEAQFWGERLHLLEKFIALSEESKQLLIRLFLRKRKWLIADKLSYANISLSLNPLFEELLRAELVDSSCSSLLQIEEAVHLLQASSLKSVVKHFKLNLNRSKSELCVSLSKFATQKNVFGITMAKRVLHKIKEELGPCFRIREEIVNIFSAIFTIYSPMDMSSTLLFDQPSINLPSQLLFVLLQLGTDKIRFPAPFNPCLMNIYTDAEKLFRYVKAKELEAQIADLSHRGKRTEIIDCAKKARFEFHNAYTLQWQFYESLIVDLRRFTDLHVYARCISHGVDALEKVRDYAEAVVWLEYMLNATEFKLILANARGGWWDRLALNFDAHLKDKDRAMKAVIAGLEDPVLGDRDRLSLQDRGRKLCDRWKGPMEEVDPERIHIKGYVVGKNLGEARTNRFLIKRNQGFCECSVEEVALEHYLKKEGFKEGVHAEGTVWHTIFGLLFYDIIFNQTIDNVWFSATQMNPADLNSRSLYTNRQDLFELRLNEIEGAELDDLLMEMEKTYNNYYGVTNSEITWDCFTNFEQIKRFMICCPILALCACIRRLVTDYRNCRSGFPDLTVWNDEKKLLAVVEVKGPGDKLSTKQRLWLNFFKNQNVIAHVCHVTARNPRKID